MGDLCIFLNSRVENSGALAWIGDKGLAPFRYLFNGKTIRIQQRESDKEIEIHHVASFHQDYFNFSRTDSKLKSSSTGMIKAALSVVLLIPGFILGVAFKGFAYLYSSVIENHRLTKVHLTPVNREIGSESDPIKTTGELKKALEDERKKDPKNRPTNTLMIHGDGILTIEKDLGILQFNPMKLVLHGVKIVNLASTIGLRFSDALTGKWQYCEGFSIDDALRANAPRRSWASCKRYHMIFNV